MLDKKVIVFLAIIGSLVITGAIMGPRITGYTVLEKEKEQLETQKEQYEVLIESYEKNYTDLVNSFLVLNKSLQSCEKNIDRTYEKVENYMDEAMECKQELNDIEDQCETEKNNILDNLIECEEDLSKKYHQYNELVKTAGNRLCCIMKVYNKDIGSFDIVDYEIKCREGTTGEHRIFCEVLE